jgi:hypothetical protein
MLIKGEVMTKTLIMSGISKIMEKNKKKKT